jgi:hypothetical protein
MGINHCGGHVFVPEQLLHRSNVVPGPQQVGGKAVPQSVRADRFQDTRSPRCSRTLSLSMGR